MPIDPVIPVLGNRLTIWIVAQLHLNFAAFILGAPIFIVVCEYLGWRNKDAKYERLAHEMAKVTAVAYSFTALLGGFFVFLLIGLYPTFSSFIFPRFFPLWTMLYPFLFLAETVFLYIYWYSWDAMLERKGSHIAIGLVLNLIGTLTMFSQNAITSFMNTPVENWETASLWQLMNNHTWWPLNIHRFIANVTFGGFITGLVAAYLFLTIKDREERAFYDWMGFIGNFIGSATFMLLAFPGYIYGLEIYAYDASLGIYLMSDRLSMFFEMQGILIGLGFLALNYYIWLSMRRIEGAERFATAIKAGFVLIFIGSAIWVTPRHFFATMIPDPGVTLDVNALELPGHLGFMALMPAKNSAALWIIIVTMVNYVLYNIAMRRGKMTWGEIETPSQYALILLGFTAIWTMSLMGAVRSLMRKSFHVYNAIPDFTAESFTPTLAYSSVVTTVITLIFFAVIVLIIWLAHHVGRAEKRIPEFEPASPSEGPTEEMTGGAPDVAVA
ncbi:MAG: cytochrome ubiquinol oxidase subunit I [Anaerolineae bacterium]